MLSDAEEELERELLTLRAELIRERRARQFRLEVSRIAAGTTGQVDRDGVAGVIAHGASEIFDAGWVMVAYVGDEDVVKFSHGPGVPDDVAREWSEAPLDTPVPICDVLRGEVERFELSDPESFAPWPLMVDQAQRARMASIIIEPIGFGDRPDAVIAIAWPHPHELDELERELLSLLVASATPAFRRSVRTEADGEMANALQKLLLQGSIPDVAGLEIATLYQPGRDLLAVGGDWFDVLELDDGQTAIIVGDVVGHDVRAAVEMSQIRNVLAAHLLATSDPAVSLDLADRYLRRRATRTMATAVVIVLDRSGSVTSASAGHLPPIVVAGTDTDTVHGAPLDIGLGPPLGARLGGYRTVTSRLEPGSIIVAVTDGVVETRAQPIDVCIDELRSVLRDTVRAGGDGSERSPVADIVGLLERRIDTSWRTDDAAAVVVQLLAD